MSNFSKNIEEAKELKIKEYNRSEKLASYFFDLSKLTFGGVVISTILAWINSQHNWEFLVAALIGVYLTVWFARIANDLLKK